MKLFAKPDDRPPGLISTDLGANDPPTVTEPPEKNWWEKRREASEQTSAQAMALLEQMNASMGGLLAISKAPPMNDVALQMTDSIATNGSWSKTWPQPFAAVMVANLSAHTLSVSSSAPGDAPPAAGIGLFKVPTGIWRLVPMRSTALTIYGTAGDLFDVAVFVRPRTPGSGSCGTA